MANTRKGEFPPTPQAGRPKPASPKPSTSPPAPPVGRSAERIHSTNDVDLAYERDVHDELTDMDYDTEWDVSTLLDAPPPRPGYVQRWVRSGSSDSRAQRVYARRIREGWRPRSLDNVVKTQYPTLAYGSRGENVIAVDDLILMEMPKERNKKRDRFYDTRRAEALNSIKANLRRTSREGGVPIESSFKSRPQTGKAAVAMDDDT